MSKPLLNQSAKSLFENRKFSIDKTIGEIEQYANKMYEQNTKELVKKPFYHYYEWSGWRFYLKAIKYKDWKSIKGHITRDERTKQKVI